jgi:hypothetical protein
VTTVARRALLAAAAARSFATVSIADQVLSFERHL